MEAVEALITRVSPARLAEPGPGPEALDRMLAAGVAAPDHGHLRPWRFIVIEGGARERFGDLLARSLAQREPGAPQGKIEAERKKPLRAPILMVVASAANDDPKIPEIEQVMAVAAAAQNVLVAAHAMGYGGFWRTGAPAYDAMVKHELGLAERDTIVGFLYIGSVGAPGPAREAQPMTCVTRWPA